MRQIVVRFVIAVIFVALVQGCSTAKPDPNTGPNTAEGQERERMNRMLNPSPNQ
jgi:type IV pilus biogenesis protein CpaD/CtpE